MVAASCWLAWNVPKVPDLLVAYGRSMLMRQIRPDDVKFLYVGEGMNSSVAVTELRSNGARNFHVSGKVEASSEPQDMRLQRMLGHLPALVHPRPKSVLIVGCGAGVTAGCFVTYPGIDRIVICEIEPLIPTVVATYFAAENHGVIRDPRVKIIYDDARHYVLTTHEKFDVITSDPIHPWVKGAAALYTREYFELCKKRLNPGGVVTQWVPLYDSTPEVVKSELATFFDAFPDGTIWGNDIEGEGYDTVLLGQVVRTTIDVSDIQRRLLSAENGFAAVALEEVGFASAVNLLGTYAGRGPDLRPWLANAQINHDSDLRLQYLAGMGLREQRGGSIYADILVYRRYPDDLFVAGDVFRQALKNSMGVGQ
jgi:spermidine synthase